MSENSKTITGEIELSSEINEEIKGKINNISEFREKIKSSLTKDTSDLMQVIMGGAIYLNSSDLHIEAEENQARIRVRLDGVLQDVTDIDQRIYEAILSRIKILSGLKLNISDRPQDGRFSVFTSIALPGQKPIEIRVSSLPSEHGESLVLRILNPKSLIDLEALGLREDLLNIFKKEIQKPNGMIIVTGPTGSGKTTTLYAFLKTIQSPEIKIITIEDPIEYHLEGISQTQTAPEKGYDFSSGLKSIVRQDPDVILVGEVRDLETAEISLQAALTGHLVFTTLHTNDAAGTIARLISLGAKPSNIGPAINMTIAQRLVRLVCSKCKQLKKPDADTLKKIKRGLKGLPKTIKLPALDEKLKIVESKGCKECNNTGYRGRIGIFEAFLIDDEMEKFILKSPSIAELKEEAIKKGMVTMYQDGLIKVIEGKTTLEELERVAEE